MKRKLISINDTAELLRCSQQTVRNWVEQGIIKGHRKGGMLMVDADTVYSLFDSIEDCLNTKHRVEEMTAEAKALQTALQEKVYEKKRDLNLFEHSAESSITRDMLVAVVEWYRAVLAPYEREVLKDCIQCNNIEEVAESYNLTRSRIIQIAHKGIRHIAKAQTYDEMRNEIERLQKENEEMLSVINTFGLGEKVASTNAILRKPITDCNLSNRALNCLKRAEIETVGDLVAMSKCDMLHFRNLGRKTLFELEFMLDSYGLSFGMEMKQTSSENEPT